MATDDRLQTNLMRVKRRYPASKPMTPSQLKVMEEVREASSVVPGHYYLPESDEEEYDTDIEPDEGEKPEYENLGVNVYLKTCRKLKQLPIRHVCEALMERTSIEVRNRGLTAYGTLSITNALLVNVTVTRLCLDGNALPSKALKYISWLLTENVAISSLSLDENRFDSEGIMELCNTIKVSTTLTKLSLAGNNLENVDASYVASMLLYNAVLQDLNLSYNNISDEGAAYLAEAIAANDYLKSIDLSWNKIRPSGIVHIAKAVKENVMLKSLNLAMNGIARDGCEALSAMLLNNDSLMFLNISNSRIKDLDASLLVPALLKNDSLRSLNMSYNTINSSTLVTLLQAIRRNEGRALNFLDMSGILIFRSVQFFAQQIKGSRSVFKFNHGDIVTYNGTMAEEEQQLIKQCNPLELLRWYLNLKRLSFDPFISSTGHLRKEELQTLLKRIGLTLTPSQLDQLYLTGEGTTAETIDIKAIIV
ncbi:leucine-rich repeat-containing protein 74B-like [Watersipora subatra]|uniref:leucine-rich repeat-containing protein 74B-like n=1 Tax=Watersipora subatra TaxID=2589382 RepID=UPI00355C9599